MKLLQALGGGITTRRPRTPTTPPPQHAFRLVRSKSYDRSDYCEGATVQYKSTGQKSIIKAEMGNLFKLQGLDMGDIYFVPKESIYRTTDVVAR